MPGRVVITGANRGIGLSMARIYAERGYSVFAACRHTSAALDQLDVELISGVDVATAVGVQTLKQSLVGLSIDVLINNAGILQDEQLGSINFDQIERQFAVNALGPLRVIEALCDQLAPAAKLALITSRMGSIADNTSGGRYGYRMSKAALNAAGKSLACDLAARGVAVAILHPGLVATDMIGGHGDITPDQAASRLIDRIDALTLQNSGTFWHSNGEELPW